MSKCLTATPPQSQHSNHNNNSKSNNNNETFTSTKQLRHTTVVVKTPTMQVARQTDGAGGERVGREREREDRDTGKSHSLLVYSCCHCHCHCHCYCALLFVCQAACCKWKLESTHLKSVCVYVCQLPAQRLPAAMPVPAWLRHCFCPPTKRPTKASIRLPPSGRMNSLIKICLKAAGNKNKKEMQSTCKPKFPYPCRLWIGAIVAWKIRGYSWAFILFSKERAKT